MLGEGDGSKPCLSVSPLQLGTMCSEMNSHMIATHDIGLEPKTQPM